MDLEEKWEKAIKETEILRSRLGNLSTFKITELPYIFLAESMLNIGDTVVRKGKVLVHQPSIILPSNYPQFEGFEFEKGLHVDDDVVRTFLLVRGISFPSLKYSNETYTLDVFEGPLKQAVGHFRNQLEKREDVHSGLFIGPEDCWQFSMLIFVATLVAKSASGDIKNILDKLKRRKKRG